jgi:predicted dehydrogenase
MSKVRYGVVGLGAIHGIHCWAVREIENAELAAVYDIVPEKTVETAEKQAVYGAESLDDLISRVDVVTVCTPSGLHSKVAIEAIKQGRHVLCEKPIDISMSAAQAMVDAADQAGVLAGVISQHRFARDIRAAKAAVESGELGRIVFGEAATKWWRTQEYYDSGDWRGTWELDGGGCLMNQGVHYVDMLQWLMGGVEAVTAQVRTLTHEIEVEDCAAAVIEFKNGAIGTLRGSTSCYPGVAESVEIHGDKGGIQIEGDKVRTWLSTAVEDGGQTAKPDGEEPKLDLSESAASDPSAAWGTQHLMQVQDFTDAVQQGRAPQLSARDALEPLKVILAIYKSAADDGRRVELSEL